MRRHELAYALNAGGVDKDALARIDLEKLRLAGEHPVENWLPRALGPATLRPGLRDLHAATANARQIAWVPDEIEFGPYILLLAPGEMRIVHNDAIVQVPSVTTATNAANWAAFSGSVTVAGDAVTVTGSTGISGVARQSVSVPAPARTLDNILRLVVSNGPVLFRVGTAAGGQDLIEDTTLDEGEHKIAINPAGAATIHLELRADGTTPKRVATSKFESGLIGGTGPLVVTTPWLLGDLPNIRVHRIGDVMFVADGRQPPRRIEHRGPRSWSVALYKTRRGPFVPPRMRNVSITPTSLHGTTLLTTSEPYWRTGHVGALVEVTHAGVRVERVLNGENQSTEHITVVGVGDGRKFDYDVSMSLTGTLTLERSFDDGDPVNWTVHILIPGAGGSVVVNDYSDGQDNKRVHYRLTIRPGDFTSGSCTARLRYKGGVRTGIARVTTFGSSTQVTCEVEEPLGNTTATKDWRISAWSDVSGWPTVPVEQDGRLQWFKDGIDYGSAPDDFNNFDDAIEGVAAPFARSVASAKRVLWAMALERLIVGTRDFEATIQSNGDDGGVTAADFTTRIPSRRGCAPIEPTANGDGLFFVQRSGRRLYDLSVEDGRYRSSDVMRLNPNAAQSGIVRIAMQFQPDARLYAVLGNGSLLVVTWDRRDEVNAITTITTPGGSFRDVCVIPRTEQDEVYVLVQRGGSLRHEKFAPEAEQRSATTCALLDGHRVITGPASTITGATHLAGQTVQVWADGQRRTDMVIDGTGFANLAAVYNRVVYGVGYTATMVSVKLAYAAGAGTAIGQTKIVRQAGLVLADSTLDGLTIGSDVANLVSLPEIINGITRTPFQFFSHLDAGLMPIISDWSPDTRFVVRASSAEGPKTIQAVVLDIETRDGSEEQQRGRNR